MALLMFAKGVRAGDTHTLGDVNIIGRSYDADVRIEDLTVSRRHARIFRSGNHYIVQDLQSGNGTIVNGKPVSEQALKDGDRIEICDNILIFYDEDGVQERSTIRMVEESSDSMSILNTVDVGTADHRATEESTHAELLQMNRRLQTVTEISQAIGFGLDEEHLLNQVLNKLFEVYPQVDRGFIILRDADTGKLSPRATKSRAEGESSEVAISQTLVRKVMQEKKAVLSVDAMDDDRFEGGASIVKFQMRSVMCAPLMSQNEILGIIQIDTKKAGFSFTEDDLKLLAGLASQAGLVVANARLHSRLLEKTRVEQDLQYATRIQHSFLPQAPPKLERLEFADWYRAALQVGGDFYDYISLPNGRLGIVVGDVSGKGVSAALLMAKVTSDIRFFAAIHNDPSRILVELNRRLFLSNVDDVFVTVLFMTLEPDSGNLVLCNAGHLPPILIGRDGQMRKIEEPSGFPIGIMEDAEFEQQAFRLDPGGAMCAFTDGIIEAMNPNQEQYGYERLFAALSSPAQSADDQVANVRASIRQHTQGTVQSDDITLTLFRRLS